MSKQPNRDRLPDPNVRRIYAPIDVYEFTLWATGQNAAQRAPDWFGWRDGSATGDLDCSFPRLKDNVLTVRSSESGFAKRVPFGQIPPVRFQRQPGAAADYLIREGFTTGACFV